MEHVRVLIVEDSVTFVRGLEVVLAEEKAFTVVGAASNKREALILAEKTRPDVALVDLRITAEPEGKRAVLRHGLELIGVLRERAPHLQVLAISSTFNSGWIVKAVQAGASGFVSKDASPEEIVNGLRTAAHGGVVLTAEQLAAVAAAPGMSVLTSREKEVLRLVAEGKSNREIAQGLRIAVGTVRAHVGNILAKLGVADRKEAVATAQQRGWL